MDVDVVVVVVLVMVVVVVVGGGLFGSITQLWPVLGWTLWYCNPGVIGRC